MPLDAYVDWIEHVSLPTWLSLGRNKTSKLFYEKLLLDGQPDLNASLRTRTQFRQLYVWSHATVLGLIDADRGLSEATESAEVLHAHLWGKGECAGWARSIAHSGSVIDPVIDLYDHACVLLGLGWLYKATDDRRYLSWINETLDAMAATMPAETGGWAEDNRFTLPRRQNPHMHQLESMMLLFEITSEARFLQKTSEIIQLFSDYYFNWPTGSLREYFGAQWQAQDRWRSDDCLEPGHHCEWVWLLRRYARSNPNKEVDVACRTLLSRAVTLGSIAPHGFLALEVNAEGKPLKDMQRLWSQVEYLKALLVQGEKAAASALFEKINTQYLAPALPGTWIDCFSLTNQPLSTDIPASSLYHLFTAVPEIMLDQGTHRYPSGAAR